MMLKRLNPTDPGPVYAQPPHRFAMMTGVRVSPGCSKSLLSVMERSAEQQEEIKKKKTENRSVKGLDYLRCIPTVVQEGRRKRSEEGAAAVEKKMMRRLFLEDAD